MAGQTLSLGQALAEPVTLTIGGKPYVACPLTLGDFAAFESWLRQKRLEVFLGMPPAMLARLDHRAKAGTIAMTLAGTFSEVDLQRELATVSGMGFMVWRSLVKRQPELTLDQVLEMPGGPRIALQMIAMISGLTPKEESTEGKEGEKLPTDPTQPGTPAASPTGAQP